MNTSITSALARLSLAVLVAGGGYLVRADGAAQVAAHLVGAHVGAVGEGDDRVAPERVGQLGVRARQRPEVRFKPKVRRRQRHSLAQSGLGFAG